MTTAITRVPKATVEALIAERDRLITQKNRIIGQAGREGRPVYYREEEEIKRLKARIARIESQLAGRSRSKSGTTTDPLERLRRTRELALRSAAGRRRRGNLSTFQARAFVSRLRGRR